MTIKRTVNGQEMEFELTWQETRTAYVEWMRDIEWEDIDCFYMSGCEHEALAHKHREEIIDVYEQLLDARSYRDTTVDTKACCAEDAVRTIVEKYKEEE